VEQLALHLLERGLRPLDRFVMQLPNIPEFVYLYFALQKVGAIPIIALAAHRYTEIEQFVRLSEAVGYAIPERLEVLEELPLSRFGKVMKQALIEQAKALVAKSPSGQKP
jgi:non-ribosomal peptide synthetase component E (peptide arylation enzyme)